MVRGVERGPWGGGEEGREGEVEFLHDQKPPPERVGFLDDMKSYSKMDLPSLVTLGHKDMNKEEEEEENESTPELHAWSPQSHDQYKRLPH